MALELVLPVIPIVSSCVISISELRNHSTRTPRYSKGHRSASVTVIILTITYIIFNAPFCVYFILATTDRYTGNKYNFFNFEVPSYNLRAFVVVVSVIMNSTINPVIYCLRFKGFRQFVIRVIENKTGPEVFVYDTSYPSQGKSKICSNPEAVTSI